MPPDRRLFACLRGVYLSPEARRSSNSERSRRAIRPRTLRAYGAAGRLAAEDGAVIGAVQDTPEATARHYMQPVGLSEVWFWLDGRSARACLIHPCLYSTAMTVSVQVDLGTLARVGTALADPTRRRVLVHLIDAPGYPAEMAEDFGTTRANLSNHLTCLRECGLVTATAEGRRIRYDLADQRLADGLRILAGLDLPGSCG